MISIRIAVWLLITGCAPQVRWAAGAIEVAGPAGRRIEIQAGRAGFSPSQVHARAGETITLVFTRIDRTSCVDRVLVYLDDRRRIERALPLKQPIAVTLRVPHPGELGISCGMQMFGAAVVVERDRHIDRK